MLKTYYASRPATVADAGHLARLVNYAGDGLAHYHWQTLAAELDGNIDPWVIGIRRAASQNSGFAYTRSLVVEVGGKVAGCVCSFPIDAANTAEELDSVNPVFRPLLELEDMVVGSRYINVLAVYPEHRGKGIGSRLLIQAEALARGRKMSLIVSDSNRDALRLYERHGYQQVASRPKIKGDWDGPGDHWILMVK